jgi:hypothetical protein
MLGGRSQQDLWINHAQLYGEVHRFVSRKGADRSTAGRGPSHGRGYGFLRDVLRAARAAFGESWGDNQRFMVTRDVTLKALVRVAADVAAAGRQLEIEPGSHAEAPLTRAFAPWSALARDFRREGFYERFVARSRGRRPPP